MPDSHAESTPSPAPITREKGRPKNVVRSYRGVIIAGAIVVACTAGGWFVYQGTTSTATAVGSTYYKSETVAKGDLKATIDGTGNLAVRDEVTVSPSVSGSVKSLKVSVGDKVEKGDVLFVLDGTEVNATIKSQSASVLSARQSVVRAQSELTSARANLALLKKNKAAGTKTTEQGGTTTTVTAADITAATQSVTAAKLGLQAANAQLSSAQQNYADAVDSQSDLSVKAPCAGTIWSLSIAKGDSVTASSGGSTSGGSSSGSSSAPSGSSSSTGSSTSGSTSSCLTIARDSVLGLQLSVAEADVLNIKVGQDVEVTFDALGSDKVFNGTVDEIDTSGTASSSVVTYGVWIVIDDLDSRLKDGMTASASIITSQESDVLLVSNASVKGEAGAYYVLVQASTNATPTKKTVTIGAKGTSQTVITSGLTAGEKIVVAEVSTTTSTTNSSSSGGAMGGGMPAGGPGGN